MNNKISLTIEKHLRRWNLIASFHRVAHVFLGLVGILCPLAIGTFADSFSLLQIRLVSFTGAASIAIFAGFEIGNLATRFREAWKVLNAARLRYEIGEISEQELIQVYERGEKTIGKVKGDPFGKDLVNKSS